MNKEERIVLAVAGFCIFTWLFGVGKVQPDPTQCDIPMNSDALIAELNSIPINEAEDDTDPMPVAPSLGDKPAKTEILIFVSKNCPPCEKWKRCEMQRFLDAGWSVGIIEVHRFPVTPRFELTLGGKRSEHVGYLTFEQAKGLLK
jgi:hypothetical protein